MVTLHGSARDSRRGRDLLGLRPEAGLQYLDRLFRVLRGGKDERVLEVADENNGTPAGRVRKEYGVLVGRLPGLEDEVHVHDDHSGPETVQRPHDPPVIAARRLAEL